MARTSLVYAHFFYLTFMCDLDFQPAQTNVSNGTTTPQGEHLYKIIFKSVHKCRSYGPDKLNLLPLYHLTFKCDLDFQPIGTDVSNGTSTPPGEQLCQIILKSIHKCRSYDLNKLIYVTFKCDLDFEPTKNGSNDTSPPQVQQLREIILKSVHKCRDYDPDKSGRTDPRTHIHLTKNSNSYVSL